MWNVPENAKLVTSTNIAGQDKKEQERREEEARIAEELKKKDPRYEGLKGEYFKSQKGPFN